MSEKLNDLLNKILNEDKKEDKKKDPSKKKEGSKKTKKNENDQQIPLMMAPGFPPQEKETNVVQDMRDEEASQMQMEPMDKIAVQIEHMFINGDFDGASKLIKKYSFSTKRGDPRFSWYHLNLLMDWVRNIYKYTNMSDLSKNYYDEQMKKEIEGISDLKKAAVKEETIDKFINDVKKVLEKKLKPS